MKPFDYRRASSVGEALEQFTPGAAYLAGGTNLVDHLRLGIREVSALIDITRLDLTQITELTDGPSKGSLSIGALVKNSDLAAHPLIRQRYPLLAEAILAGASGQIRNMASTGGNLLQRTRCVYFQDLTTPCNKREPGSGCSAQEGFGRYNAILGLPTAPAQAECVAVHPSDMCVALAVLDAVVVVQGQAGERRIPFAAFHRLADNTPQQDTNLQAGELITALELPAALEAPSTYRKVRERASYAFALVSVAAVLELDGTLIRSAKLAFGGAAHKPWRADKAEAMLQGKPATTENFRAAIEAELAQAQAGKENAFKIPMLRNTAVAVLEELRDGTSIQRRAEQASANPVQEGLK